MVKKLLLNKHSQHKILPHQSRSVAVLA